MVGGGEVLYLGSILAMPAPFSLGDDLSEPVYDGLLSPPPAGVVWLPFGPDGDLVPPPALVLGPVAPGLVPPLARPPGLVDPPPLPRPAGVVGLTGVRILPGMRRGLVIGFTNLPIIARRHIVKARRLLLRSKRPLRDLYSMRR